MLIASLFSQDTVKFALLGLAAGAPVALVAVGVVAVHRASGVLNFSASAMGAIAAFLFYQLKSSDEINWILALVIALIVGAALGALTAGTLRLMTSATTLTKTIGTLALALCAQGFIIVIWGSAIQNSPGILPTTTINLTSDIVIPEDRLIIIGMVVVIGIALRIIYTKTSFGLITSGVSESKRIVATSGWSPNLIELINFAIGGALSAFAAILLAPIVTLSGSVLYLTIIPALAASLVGRFKSFEITIAAALAIGILQSELLFYEPNIANGLHVSLPSITGIPDLVPLLIVIAAAAMGSTRLDRGETFARLPRVGTGIIRPVWMSIGALGLVLILMTVPIQWVAPITTTIATAILILSVVLVTGYAGQLSLCQYALAGFGGWVAARFAASAGVPFGFALLLGVVLAVPAGLLIALPALRTRGINLAIATLGLALMMNSLIFNNGSLTGGYFGSVVAAPNLFGISLSPITEARRYGIFVVLALICAVLVVANIRRGQSGRRLLAVRANERAAAALGIGVRGAKLFAFGAGAAVAALAGVLLSFQTNNIVFTEYDAPTSIQIVLYCIFGGVGYLAGGLFGGMLIVGGVGAMIGMTIFGNLQDFSGWLLLFAGVNVLGVLIQSPDGIAALHGRQLSRFRIARYQRKVFPSKESSASRKAPELPPHPPCIISLKDVTVRFGGVVALDAVSLTVNPGEVLGLIGPNGAGKTTTLDVLTGFTGPSEGDCLVDGVSVNRWTPERRARSGIARSWQNLELFDDMTVRQNLLTASDRHRVRDYFIDLVRPGRNASTAWLDEMVDDFQLGSVLELEPPVLPHGTARLVAIARAMVGQPSALLLDEPAAGLSAGERRELASAIRRLARERGVGVLLVEHDVELVMSVADQIVVLDFGRKIAEGTPDEIRMNPAVIHAYLGETSTERLGEVAQLEGVTRDA